MSGINDEPCYYDDTDDCNHNHSNNKNNKNIKNLKNTKNLKNKDNEKYHEDLVSLIEIVYLIAAILWIILIFALGIFQKANYMVWIFMFLPLVVFIINYINLNNITYETEKQMLRGNFLSFGFIVAVILINWNSPGNSDKSEFFKLLIAAFILMMVSLVDIWVDEKYMPVIKHMKTALHTMSLSLLAISLYLYYVQNGSQ